MVNQNVLEKAVGELKKENPNIHYVLGMLETLIELGKPTDSKIKPAIQEIKPTEESNIMDREASARLQNVLTSIQYE